MAETRATRGQTIVIGTVSDSSNAVTEGKLGQVQVKYLSALASSLDSSVILRSSSHQHPSLRNLGISGNKLWPLYLELLSRREDLRHKRRYKSSGKVRRLSQMVATARIYTIPVIRFASSRYRRQLSSLKAVETVVSDKHIYLWTSLIESDSIGAVIFESDFDPGPMSAWGDVPNLINEMARDYDYMDFSASFGLEKLGLPGSSEPLSLAYLTTNTLCAYWISRSAAEAALLLLGRKPWLRAIGADFLLNAVNSVAPFRSLLVPKPLIKHASMANRSKSTIGTL